MSQHALRFPRFAQPLLCAATFALAAGSASAQVVVQSQNGSDMSSSFQLWCDQHIPAPFRLHDRVVVRLMTDDEMTAYLHGDDVGGVQTHQDVPGDTDDIDGIFEDNPARISLRISDGEKPDMFTFAHEYGHYVWFHVLSGSDRKRYQAIYKRDSQTNHLVTRYAETDVQEGFAEAFSFYIVEPVILNHRDPDSSTFLNQFTQAHGIIKPA